MDHSDQQSVERFVSTICGGDFAEQLARTFAANQVPVGTPTLSVILENRTILGLSIREYGEFGTAQRHYVMMMQFARLIRSCRQLGAVLIDDPNCVPSDDILHQLRQAERLRRQEASN